MCWWPAGNVYGRSKLLTVMYALIKRYEGSPRKFVFLQSSSPDVQREGGGGKTNISLLESSEEWASGLKTSTIWDWTQKFGEKKMGTGYLVKGLLHVSHLVESLCLKHPNCEKKKISSWVYGEKKNCFLAKLTACIFMQRDQKWHGLFMKYNLRWEKQGQQPVRAHLYFNRPHGKYINGELSSLPLGYQRDEL